MTVSLRMSAETKEKLKQAAEASGRTQSRYILDLVEDSLGLSERERKVRALAGWMSDVEAAELSENLAVFETVHPGDWA
ncbi:MAG: TraY domain-containing protein [Acidobacteria bacterium]|nr:TraY domain-containing protein [Acidobacteriota bacterium]